jgi:ABC-type nickel/cobalt efflux system permease component RcnA
MHDPLSRLTFRALALLAFGLSLLVAALMPAGAETNPPAAFGVPAAAPSAPRSAFTAPQAAPLRANGPFAGLLSWVADTQQSMQRDLAASVKRLKSGNAIAAVLALAGLSFLYGVVHAVGPGHGKAIISSYVVANEETVRRGIMISFLAAAMQAVTAIALVSALLIAFSATGLELNAWSNQLESVSYALIALIGLYLLSTQILQLWRRSLPAAENHAAPGNPGHEHADHHSHRHHDHAHDQHRAHGEACDHCGHIVEARQFAGPFSWRKVMAVVFSVGIRPCTGAILVLVFALTQGLFWAGVAATFAMALGTAITVAVLASLALGSRELALKLGGASASWANAVWTTCAIGGAAVIFLFGALLFMASLGPARPF